MTVARFRLQAEIAARRRAQELARRAREAQGSPLDSESIGYSVRDAQAIARVVNIDVHRRQAPPRRFRKPFYRPWGVAQGVTPDRPGRWLAWAILALLAALAAYLLIVCLAWGALA